MLAAVLFPLAAAIVLGVPTLPLLRRMQAIQKISEYAPESHQAKKGTPTMGGLMMLGALFLTLLLSAQFEWPAQRPPAPSAVVVAAWLLLGFGVVGFLDDYVVPRMSSKRGLGWVPKLILQFGVATPLSYLYFGKLGLGPTEWALFGWTAAILAAVAIVALANAFNFTDGLDGLAAGTMALAALGLALTGSTPLFACSLIGVSLGFLFYNAPPAKVFMGDTGSLPLGALFAFALLDSPRLGPWSLLLCGVFLIELLPVPIQIASVKLFKRRVFYRTPIHHAFEAKGVPETRVTGGFVIAQGLLTLAYVVLSR